jgi:tRNA dimethylallyltransferase
MGIITSKPGEAILSSVKHHLIGVVSPEDDYDVWRFRRDALKILKGIIRRKIKPIFVGGTGLYMSVLIDGIFEQPAIDRSIREKLYKMAKAKGGVYLYSKLKKVDPVAAAKIHPNDTKRIIRALEVFNSTGKPISELQKSRKGLKDEFRVQIFCLNMPRERLYRNINMRVDEMFEKGLITEVRRLLKKQLSRTAGCAIGIKELGGYFDAACSLEEAKELMKRNTRRYAKRQLTWFRKDKRITWIKIKDTDSPKRIAQRLWKKLS